jgi:hypothetical protein
MTALNFPLSPSDGDTYGGYIYDGTKGVWNANALQRVARFTVSATAPTSPENGDAWFDTTSGLTYVYYVDADSAQWIETGNPNLGFVNLDGLTDVDLTGLVDGNSIVYDEATETWIPGEGGGGGSITVSSTAPSEPSEGDLWFDPTDGRTYVFYSDYDGDQWVEIGANTANPAPVTISATAPSSAVAGDLWWDSDNGNLYMYYDDGSSQQWIASNGPQVFVGTAAPAGYQGQLWFNSTNGRTYIYYDDGTTGQWVSAVGEIALTSADLPTGTVLQVVSTTKTDTFSQSIAAGAESSAITGLSASITPSATSSKVLITVDIVASTSAGTGQGVFIFLERDGTAIAIGDGVGSRKRVSSSALVNDFYLQSMSFSFLDSPATTSSISYTLKIAHGSGTTRTVYVNRTNQNPDNVQDARTISTITAMEIAG